MHASALDRPLGVKEAYDALDRFGQQSGRLPLLLLLHAAVPQSFRADFLNLVKLNFLAAEAGTDPTVDADVLLSPLVHPAAAGYYRLDAEVRRHALALVDAAYRDQPERRTVQVARLLLAYTDSLERETALALDPMLAEYLAIQRWVALAFIDPNGAAEAFARAIDQGLDDTQPVVRLRLGSVTAAVAIPLSGHQRLLAYARGIDAIAGGDRAAAERLLEWYGDEELRVGGVSLRPGRQVLQRLTRRPAREEAQGGGFEDEPRRRQARLVFGVPAPLPMVHREEGLARVRQLLLSSAGLLQSRPEGVIEERPTVVTIVGADGLGKWTLATSIAHDPSVVEHFTDGIIWLGQDGSGYPRAALKAYAEAIDVHDLFGDAEVIDRERFRAVFAERRVLFVADHRLASDILPTLFESGTHCAVLRLQTDIPTDLSLRIVLEPLSTRDAGSLFASRGTRSVPSSEIVEFAGGNPLLVRLLAGAIFISSPSRILERLRTHQPPRNDDTAGPKIRLLVETLFELSAAVREGLPILNEALGNGTQVDLPGLESLASQFADLGLADIQGPMLRVPHPVRWSMLEIARRGPAQSGDVNASTGFERTESQSTEAPISPAARRFEYDWFVSYAHLDDAALIEGHKGWIANLHRALEIRVKQLSGREISAWRDPKLQGSDQFLPELFDRVKDSAVFIAVVSPRYVRSQWALQELSVFSRAVGDQGTGRVRSGSRIFKVLKTPVPLEAQPELLRSLLGYEFYAVDKETGKVREFDEVFGPDAQRNFWLRLDDLAHDIVAALEELGQLASDVGGDNEPVPQPPPE